MNWLRATCKPQEAEQAHEIHFALGYNTSMQVATMIVRAWLEIGEVDLAFLNGYCGILGGQKERRSFNAGCSTI